MSNLYRDAGNVIEETWRTRAAGIRCPDPQPPIDQPLGRLFERYARDEKLIAAIQRYDRRQRAFKIIRQALVTLAFIAGVIGICYFISR